MNAYLALIRMNVRLSFRDRGVIFFNYLFPLIFFFIFAQLMKAEQSGVINQVVNMVLTIGILGSGLWGQGMRMVSDREQNILRRFKVAPISPVPILVSSIVVGLIHFMPVVLVVLGLAHYGYGMPFPDRPVSLLAFIAVGLLAFRGVGLIAASVVNSMQESQIVIQILYMPMMFLSGATIPIILMPNWVQILSQFLPATHLFSGMQSILLAHESIFKNMSPLLALATTAVVGVFIGTKLFRWEKEEKLKPAAKLWVLGVLAPFVLLGVYQAYSKDNIAKMKSLDRTLDRSGSVLIKDARIFVGDGTVIESGSVLVRNGKIETVFTGPAPEAKSLRAAEVQAAGKTLVPGLIDTHVDLGQKAGSFEKPDDFKPAAFVDRAVAAYLYSGVTAVRTVGGPIPVLQDTVSRLANGTFLGAELYLAAPSENPTRLSNAPRFEKGVVFTPMLAALEAAIAWKEGRADPLNRSLVQQVGPPSLLKGTKAALTSHADAPLYDLDAAKANLKKAYEAGAILVAGTGSGSPLTIHGPAIHREMQLWAQAGIPAKVILQAATANAAKELGIQDRVGLIKQGYEASYLLLDGNPLEDISATERLSSVTFKGERIRRTDLFDQK